MRRFDIGPLIVAVGSVMLLVSLFMDWYGDLKKGAAIQAMSELLTGRTDANGFVNAAQAVADKIAADANVKKFKRK